MTEKQAAWHLAKNFGVRQNICVPNLSWGMGFWEMDLAVCTKAGYLYEVEIKCSMADLRNDRKKMKWRNPYYIQKFDAMISEYYIAAPIELAKRINPDDIQSCAGILGIDPDAAYSTGIVQYLRPTTKKRGRKLTVEERYQLARLGTMRYWSEMERQQKKSKTMESLGDGGKGK